MCRAFDDTHIVSPAPPQSLSPDTSTNIPGTFNWADDAESLPIHVVLSDVRQPRDLSELRSGSTNPFDTLQRRHARYHGARTRSRRTRQNNFYSARMNTSTQFGSPQTTRQSLVLVPRSKAISEGVYGVPIPRAKWGRTRMYVLKMLCLRLQMYGGGRGRAGSGCGALEGGYSTLASGEGDAGAAGLVASGTTCGVALVGVDVDSVLSSAAEQIGDRVAYSVVARSVTILGSGGCRRVRPSIRFLIRLKPSISALKPFIAALQLHSRLKTIANLTPRRSQVVASHRKPPQAPTSPPANRARVYESSSQRLVPGTLSSASSPWDLFQSTPPLRLPSTSDKHIVFLRVVLVNEDICLDPSLLLMGRSLRRLLGLRFRRSGHKLWYNSGSALLRQSPLTSVQLRKINTTSCSGDILTKFK
ncbi:hypothetical protein B0H13DRAFT_1864447 [Mycena leptocephala]|nr:hypothetical protein B0H13DRAFT_1864447 [Mycena leptocephala]